MWVDAAEELVGGGILGGTFAVLMVMAFERVISVIILIILIAITFIFTIGLTPDKVIIYIKYKNMLRKERKAAELYELEQQQEEERREELKHKSRLTVKRRDDEEPAAAEPMAVAEEPKITKPIVEEEDNKAEVDIPLIIPEEKDEETDCVSVVEEIPVAAEEEKEEIPAPVYSLDEIPEYQNALAGVRESMEDLLNIEDASILSSEFLSSE